MDLSTKSRSRACQTQLLPGIFLVLLDVTLVGSTLMVSVPDLASSLPPTALLPFHAPPCKDQRLFETLLMAKEVFLYEKDKIF